MNADEAREVCFMTIIIPAVERPLLEMGFPEDLPNKSRLCQMHPSRSRNLVLSSPSILFEAY